MGAENQVGLVVKPELEAVVTAFFDIEKGLYQVRMTCHGKL